MIAGIGIDLVDIERIKQIIIKWEEHFLNKVYTPNEIKYCEERTYNRFQTYAGFFAAKEACVKALGTGIQEGIKWKDIEIRNDNRGEPFICLSGLAQASASNKEISNIRVSISHSKKLATAQVIMEI
jgi:holo-[acyl-carrier protein] synthase